MAEETPPDESLKQALLSLLRTALAVGGGVLIGKGVIDAATFEQISAALLVLAPAAWGAWGKYKAEQKTKAREVAAVNAGVALAKTEPQAVGDTVRPADVPQIIKDFAPPKEEVKADTVNVEQPKP